MRKNTSSTHPPSIQDATGISRLQFLGLSACALCGLGLSALPLRDSQNTGSLKLKIGISTLGFPDLTNASLAKEIAGAGIHLVQLFFNQADSRFWNYNGRSDVSSLTPGRCRDIASAYQDAGITIHSIGVYTNLIHPDAAERKANLDYFEAMMKIGEQIGVQRFISEAGHYRDLKGPEPEVPLHFQDEVWPQMVATIQQLAVRAEKYHAKVLLEPFFRGFFASAKRLRMFLEEVRSPSIRALLDPANLIEVNDLDEMFQQLGSWIDCLHAKDRKLHTDRGVAAGKGDLDYSRFVTLTAQYAPTAPLILEYVGPGDYREALSHLRRVIREVGLGEE